MSIVSTALEILVGQAPLIELKGRSILLFPELVVLIVAMWTLISSRFSLRRVASECWDAVPNDARLGVVLIVAGGCVGAGIALSQAYGLAALKAWFFFPVLAFLLLLRSGEAAGKWLKVSFAGVAVGQGAYGLWLVADGFPGRLAGSFSSPNHAAMILAPAFMLAGLESVASQGRARIAWGAVAVFLLVSVLATASVGAMLGLICAGVCLMARSGLPRRIRVGLGIVLATLALVGSALVISRVQAGEANSFASRAQIWQTALVLGSEQPLTGIGIDAFPQRYADSVVGAIGHVPIEWVVPLPHNLLLGFWLCTGVLGLAGFCLIAAFALRQAEVAAFAPFIVLLGHGLIDTPYFYPPVTYVFWLTLALGIVYSRQKSSTRR